MELRPVELRHDEQQHDEQQFGVFALWAVTLATSALLMAVIYMQ
jgi:hypothetical protein